MRVHLNVNKVYASIQMKSSVALYVLSQLVDGKRRLFGNVGRIVKRGFGWYRVISSSINELRLAVRRVISAANTAILASLRFRHYCQLIAERKVKLIAASFGAITELTTVCNE